MVDIKELQEKILKLPNNLKEPEDFKKESIAKDVRVIAKELIRLLEYSFILRLERYYSDKVIETIIKFLKNKKRTVRIYEGAGFFWDESFGIEALKIDKDFFIKYLQELFFPTLYDYQFEDSKIKITLTHDGDLEVEEK